MANNEYDDNRSNKEPESFIVQNIYPGYHCVSDSSKEGINWTFEPFEIRDLTWENRSKIQSSLSLQRSLKNGYLRRITAEERDIILNKQARRQQEELFKTMKEQKRLQSVQVDDREMEAETLNLAKGDAGRSGSSEVSTAGYANDPRTYAETFRQYVNEAARNGDVVDAEDFNRIVQENDGQLPSGYSYSGKNSSVSGDPNRARATVTMQSNDNSGATHAQRMNMSNFNTDGYLAGSNMNRTATTDDYVSQRRFPEPKIAEVSDPYYDNENNGLAEEIDLNKDEKMINLEDSSADVKHPKIRRTRK